MTELTHEDPAQPAQPPLGARLTGWKDIAVYVDRGVRTAQRWEREFGLPVRRMGTDRSESVFAFTVEIDAWLATASAAKAKGLEPVVATEHAPPAVRPQGARYNQRWVWLVAGVVLGLVAVIGWGLAALAPPAADALTPEGTSPAPIATYTLDEGTGTALRDSGPAKVHGSITNGAWAEGRVGKGLDFAPGHRSGQHLIAVFPGAFPFHAPGTDASLSFWMRPVDSTHRTLFWTRGDPHSPDADRFHIYTGGVHRLIGPAIGIDYLSPLGSHHLLFETQITLRRWTHITLVRAGTRHYTLYVDGEPVASCDDASPHLPTYSADWALWRMEDNSYPKQNGMLDEISLWRRALSAQEVKAIYTSVPPQDSVVPKQGGANQ